MIRLSNCFQIVNVPTHKKVLGQIFCQITIMVLLIIIIIVIIMMIITMTILINAVYNSCLFGSRYKEFLERKQVGCIACRCI